MIRLPFLLETRDVHTTAPEHVRYSAARNRETGQRIQQNIGEVGTSIEETVGWFSFAG